MVSVVVRHKVEDYTKWKTVYDEHGAVRKMRGCRGARVYQNVNDCTEQIVITIGIL